MTTTAYKCPVCLLPLHITGKSCICENGHNFDIAKEGYVNLALGKSDSGDSAEMCLSRRRFLSKGYYEKFALLLCETLNKYAAPFKVLDAGCGEGYYLRAARKYFPNSELYGVDLAKEAIKLAAKSEKTSYGEKNRYSVCGIFSLPFFDETFNAVISVFAPVGEKENFRVLKEGGFMFVAGPGKYHLSGLKKAIYENPYDNEEKLREYEGFKYIGKELLDYNARIAEEDITDLFAMTPYYWKTSRSDAQKLLRFPFIDTELSFEISVYQKIT